MDRKRLEKLGIRSEIERVMRRELGVSDIVSVRLRDAVERGDVLQLIEYSLKSEHEEEFNRRWEDSPEPTDIPSVTKAKAGVYSGYLPKYGVASEASPAGSIIPFFPSGIVKLNFADPFHRDPGDQVFLSNEVPGKVTCAFQVGYPIGVYLGEDNVLLSRIQHRQKEHSSEIREFLTTIREDPPEKEPEDILERSSMHAPECDDCLSLINEFGKLANRLPGISISGASTYDNRERGNGIGVVFWFDADDRGMFFLARMLDKRYGGGRWKIGNSISDNWGFPKHIFWYIENNDLWGRPKAQNWEDLQGDLWQLIRGVRKHSNWGNERWGLADFEGLIEPLEEEQT